MPFGDETLIGERGVNLSGGQKARVNLARYMHRPCSIFYRLTNVCAYIGLCTKIVISSY